MIFDICEMRHILRTNKFNSLTHTSQGYIICLVGTLIWAFTAIFIRYLTENYQLPALVLAFWRDLFVFLTLGLVYLLFNRSRLKLQGSHWGFLFIYGFVLSIFNSLWTVSVALNGAAVSTVLAYSSAAFTAVLAWQIFKEKLGPLKILAVVLSLIGCVFVSGAYSVQEWSLNALGIITGLLSGIAFASYSLMGKAASQRGINPWTTLFYTFGFAAIFLFAYDQILGRLGLFGQSANLMWLGNEPVGWLVLIALAVGPTIGGYGLYTVSLTYLPASVANLIATLEPAITAMLAYLFLGERLTYPQILGSCLIISGVVILRVSEGRASTQEQPIVAD